MVGIMDPASREKLESLSNSVKFASDLGPKLEFCRQLKHDLLEEDAATLSEFLPRILDLYSDPSGPVRKLATQIIGEIGVKHLEFVPEIAPFLITVLEDATPAVARQSIFCSIDLFRHTLEKITIQGLQSSELASDLESSWSWLLKLKEKIYSIAFQPGSGGIRLVALKFVEAVILLYTPNPNGSAEPPPNEGTPIDFNITWLHGRHPFLNVGDLSIEASQRLVLLLDQLRFPTVKSLTTSVIVVLINRGSCLWSTSYFENALLSCLKCTHPSAAPWRDRLLGALKEMKAGGLAELALIQVNKINGSVEDNKDYSSAIKEEKPMTKACDAVVSNVGRKRSGSEDSNDLAENDGVSGKRVRSSPSVSEEATKELNRNTSVYQGDISSIQSTKRKDDVDTGPVQQLVAMFGALVAQGEKAVGSLGILISSISADLLAEVVMANMRNLPPAHPHTDADDELLEDMCIVGSDTQAKYPPSFLVDVVSLSSTFPPIASLLNSQQPVPDEIVIQKTEAVEEDDSMAGLNSSVAYAGMGHEAENALLPGMEKIDVLTPSDIHDVGNLESDLPGLGSSFHDDGLSDAQAATSLVSTDLEDASQEQGTSFGGKSPLHVLPSISVERSEEFSPKTTVNDSGSVVSSTATSVVSSRSVVLPKMSAPVVNLSDDQKDAAQKLAYIRIIEAYKQISVAGGSQVRSSLLAYLGVELPSELDLQSLLREHILLDYINHEGHELTLRVLYRLFGEAEAESDFFSCTTAASAYETFLLAVAEILRDSFPPSDKSLSKLLGEAPHLPKSVLNLLECLCSPGISEKAEESQSGDRVTQGLSTVWSLILLRPPIRDVCLKIALQSAVHHLEEVRMKAIRLVANKLYPLPSISQQIEDFAKEILLSAVNVDAAERTDAEGLISESHKDSELEKPLNEHQSMSATGKDISADVHQSETSQSGSSPSVSEAQRCMSLYFALCTKKHSLFGQIFIIYGSASKAVKQAIHRQIPILVRTMGLSSDLLEIISDPPSGSENLLIQVLQTLTEGKVPSAELIFTIKKLFDSKLKDVEILVPVLPFLPGDEVLLLFPYLVNLPLDKFQVALTCLLQGSSQSGPVLSPAEVLIAIHGVDPERDGIPLKKVIDACNACFEQRSIFTQQVLAKVLNQLVEQIPLPLLFMRTVLQAIGAFPALVEFIMEILSRLIWKNPKLWVGFLKCALSTQPHSFSVLLQLPPPQLENALNRTAALKAPLVAHASQPNIRTSLPRSVLAVLGLATESQSSSQAQTSQAHTGDTSNSEKDAVAEKSKESSSAS
ncbi:HEAT repeat-containing protein isoform 2 [Hibiscus syriacus]|uniref:HEAT repeat-containing protein isoform 2 n=1 Tax=Hibiscus syriacus TaxID=106335 RepID=A0A6A3CI95_HIBSY|nr:HEAT repeat-containing protein isoform 2 [Hibiscus syriacus]